MPRASVVLRRWLTMLFSVFGPHRPRLLPPPTMWCVLLILLAIRIDQLVTVNADCWYESTLHEEGIEVQTNEPCLNCTCNRGVLLCYLRVCPRLPNPPPTGCILLHRFKSCCPELICTDIPAGNSIEARAELNSFELMKPFSESYKFDSMKNACITNGSIYAPGSAMDSSSDCEYCYCIHGEQKCVRPKCLLPLDGCVPAYTSNECCPIHYNCTRDLFTTTTTLAPEEYENQGGCVVDGQFYPEGGKVLGIGHSICDNCYCLRGLVRCEPLLCGAPLLGCTPVIRAGECCAASYNCSGAIETQPEPNYGQFPIVSKEYAKLRKEVQYKRAPAMRLTERPPTVDEDLPYYVIAESKKDNALEQEKTQESVLVQVVVSSTTSEASTTTTSQKPFEHYSMLHNDLKNAEYIQDANRLEPEIYYARTKVSGRNPIRKHQESNQQERPGPDIYREDSLATTIRHKKYTSSQEFQKMQNSLAELRYTRQDDALNMTSNQTIKINATSEKSLQTEITTLPESTTTDVASTTSNDQEEIITIEMFLDESITTEGLNTDNTTQESTTPGVEVVELITVRSVSNSTDCITDTSAMDNETVNDLNIISNRIDINDDINNTSTTTEIPSTISEVFEHETSTTYETTRFTENPTTEELSTEIATMVINPEKSAVTSEIKIALKSILNKSADYDYDYAAPTLPPSLPNLRIIPFVAADALESKPLKLRTNNVYTQEGNFPFANHFSPPTETEGGFVPKEPPIMLVSNFYNDYRTTNVESNSVTGQPAIPALTNPPKTNENNCMVDGNEVKHSESVTPEGNCALCVCFYGSIVCHEPQCPIPGNGCRNSNKIERSTCCPEIICDNNESPTVVLEATSSQSPQATIHQSISPDPFKDVIKTEPAPDLQLLIGDMSNYLLKQSSTTTTPSTTTIAKETTTAAVEDDHNDLSFNKIWDILFSSVTEESKVTTTTTPRPITSSKPTAQTLGLHIKTANTDFAETRESIGDYVLTATRQEYVPGLLKLAGCNIYGRMYRVGRIISELSGPCMECKCTEIGVQCENLSC